MLEPGSRGLLLARPPAPMSLALKARQKVRRKGAAKDRVFGCDLLEHLQQSGQEGKRVACFHGSRPALRGEAGSHPRMLERMGPLRSSLPRHRLLGAQWGWASLEGLACPPAARPSLGRCSRRFSGRIRPLRSRAPGGAAALPAITGV